MSRLSRNLSLLWRTERLIAQRQLMVVRKQTGLFAVAGLVAIFGLFMLGIAAFFALKPLVGEAAAALIVGVADIVIALIVMTVAGKMSVEDEIAPAVEVRDMTLQEIEAEAEEVLAEVQKTADDVRKIARDPFGALAPNLASPLISAVIRGLRKSD